MALEGSLKEFNVADILQLIFFQKKTGALVLLGRRDKIRILFHEGNIVGADSRTRLQDRRLVWILVKRGMLDQEPLDRAVDKAKAEGGKFTHHLVASGVITKEDVQGIYTYLVNEIMARVFGMQEGRYEFKPQAIPLDKELGVELNTEHFLMEGVRLVDEWTEIGNRVGLEDVFLREEQEEVKLEEKEERVIEYVDGVSDVADIADLTGLDSFTVADTLLQLEEKGALYRMSATPEDEAEAPVVKKKARPIPLLGPMIGVLVVVCIAASMGLYLKVPVGMETFLASEQVSGLRLDINSLAYSDGAYPRSIDATDPWGSPLNYKLTDKGFVIFSSGPDKSPGTPDDIY